MTVFIPYRAGVSVTPVSFVNAYASGVGVFNTTLTLDVPSGLSDGDVMIADVTFQSNRTVTPPAGWTLIESSNVDGGVFSECAVVSYWKIADSADNDTGGSPSATYTWTFNLDTRYVGSINGYTGNDTISPIDDSGVTEDVTSTTDIVAPSVTGSDGGMLHYVGSISSNGVTNITPPSGMTESTESTSVNDHSTQETAYESLGADGATGTRTGSSDLAGQHIGINIAIAPA